MSHISANNIDMKLIIVSMPMFSESRNPNVAITLVCGGGGSQFQNGRHEFSMPHISANNIDMTLICVSLSLISGPQIYWSTSGFVNPACQLLLTRRGKTRMDDVGIVFELYIATL